MYSQVFKLHSQLLKAMSHPKRLEVIHLLRDQKLTVSQIQTMLDLPQANLSQHLMILRQAGVVTTQRQGKEIVYTLAHPNFSKASDLLREFLIAKHQDTPLGDHLTRSMSDLVPLVHDPVCGMRLSPKTAGYHHHYHGENFYFCASGCLKEFKANSNKYITKN